MLAASPCQLPERKHRRAPMVRLYQLRSSQDRDITVLSPGASDDRAIRTLHDVPDARGRAPDGDVRLAVAVKVCGHRHVVVRREPDAPLSRERDTVRAADDVPNAFG